MSECLPDFPRYVKKALDGSWHGADHQNGPWRPIPAPQSGLPWKTDGPAVPESREPASVAADASPTPADHLALAACLNIRIANGHGCAVPCNTCRRHAAAVIRELAEQVVPDGPKPSADSDYHLMCWSKVLDQHAQRQQTRTEILTLATELEGLHG